MVIFVALIYPHRKIQIIIYSRLIMRFTQTKAAILDCRDGTTTSRNVSIWVYTIRMMLPGVSKPRNHKPFVKSLFRITTKISRIRSTWSLWEVINCWKPVYSFTRGQWCGTFSISKYHLDKIGGYSRSINNCHFTLNRFNFTRRDWVT